MRRHLLATAMSVSLIMTNAACASPFHPAIGVRGNSTNSPPPPPPPPPGFDPLNSLARGVVADNLMQGNFYLRAGPAPLYVPTVNNAAVRYNTADWQNLKAMGITYVRIAIDIQQILPNLPFNTVYELETSAGSTVWEPVPGSIFKTASTSYVLPDGTTGALPGPSGCLNSYFSTACSVEYDLQYLDASIVAAQAQGIAVALTIFVGKAPTASGRIPLNCSDGTITCPSVPAGTILQDLMGSGSNCYGYVVLAGATCFEEIIKEANLALVARYATAYPNANQVFFEIYNEPFYQTATGTPSYRAPAIWNSALVSITNAIRAVPETAHWLISDGMDSAKAENLHTLVPTSDVQTIVSFHKYDPFNLTNQNNGAAPNPFLVHPRPSTGEPAIGRPGGIISAYMPFPAPVAGVPTSAYGVRGTGGDCIDPKTGKNLGTVTWGANATTAVVVHNQQVCIVDSSGTTHYEDLYDGTAHASEVTEAELYDPSGTGANNGMKQAFDYAAAGGHTGPLAASPIKLMLGEFGIFNSADYLSRLQWVSNIIDIANTHGVAGGQSFLPWTLWSFTAKGFGLRPKTFSYQHLCLGTGSFTGYDADLVARMTYPLPDVTPKCSGPGFDTPGY